MAEGLALATGLFLELSALQRGETMAASVHDWIRFAQEALSKNRPAVAEAYLRAAIDALKSQPAQQCDTCGSVTAPEG